VPTVVNVPRIDPVKWRNLLRTVWDAEPGLITAKLIFNALYSQFQEMVKMRDDVLEAAVYSLAGWDQQFENYRGRLNVYRGIVFDSAEQVDDPLTELVPRFVKPVFDGDYSGITGDPDASVEWPGFRLPKPLVADAMTGAMLYNQLLEVVLLSDEQATTKYAYLGACFVTAGHLYASPLCLAAIGMHYAGHVTKAKESAEQLGAEVSKAVDDAVKAVADAAAGIADSISRGLNAAAQGISFGLKALGVVLGATFLYFIYQKTTEDSHG
jgi:hypothetical protein